MARRPYAKRLPLAQALLAVRAPESVPRLRETTDRLKPCASEKRPLRLAQGARLTMIVPSRNVPALQRRPPRACPRIWAGPAEAMVDV